MDKELTLGIPTYNRREEVVKRVKEHLSSGFANVLPLTVIDNHSPDGTFEELSQIITGSNIQLIKQERNVGYAKNFISLFRQCKTKYLIILSDEDKINYDTITDYIAFLTENKPLAASPCATIADKVYRGINQTRLIEAKEFRQSSFYISGLTFDVSASTNHLNKIEHYIDHNNYAALLYPQVMLMANLILKGDCLWVDDKLTHKVAQLEGHLDLDAGKYYFLPSRWNEFKSFLSFFDDLMVENQTRGEAMITEMKFKHSRSISHLIRKSVLYEFPELEEALSCEKAGFLDLNGKTKQHRGLIKLVYNPTDFVLSLTKKWIS